MYHLKQQAAASAHKVTIGTKPFPSSTILSYLERGDNSLF